MDDSCYVVNMIKLEDKKKERKKKKKKNRKKKKTEKKAIRMNKTKI